MVCRRPAAQDPDRAGARDRRPHRRQGEVDRAARSCRSRSARRRGFSAGSMQRLTGNAAAAWRQGAGDRRAAAGSVASRLGSASAAPAPDGRAACRSRASASSISRWAGPGRSAPARSPISAPTSSRSRRSSIRTGGAASTAGRPMCWSKQYEKTVRFCIMNRNKRGITLDLTRPIRASSWRKRLVADADLVVDNYSVEVLPKLGLGYDVAEQAQSETRDDVDVGLRRRQRASRLPRLWLDAGTGLGPAERGRRRRTVRRS